MALREGNERQPKHPVPSMVPPEGGTAYFVRDGDTWELVAHNYHLDAKELIRYNFKTTDPKEVNWYLHWYVGCKLPDLPQYNWTFSSGIKGGMGYWKKGVIYLPPGANLDCPIGEICFSKEEGDEIFVHYVTMRVPTADNRKQGRRFPSRRCGRLRPLQPLCPLGCWKRSCRRSASRCKESRAVSC